MSKEAFSLLHSGVQEAIWKMGWKEFKPIQVQAIQTICETEKHLVICAPTAGGKTEAAFLPIISKLAANPQPSVQAIYVGPLKALINDQFRRLEELCDKLEIPVHRWHGDVPANQKKACGKNHPASCSSRRNRWNPISSTMACKCRACISIFHSW